MSETEKLAGTVNGCISLTGVMLALAFLIPFALCVGGNVLGELVEPASSAEGAP